jgi:hypothetical protein
MPDFEDGDVLAVDAADDTDDVLPEKMDWRSEAM